MSRSVLLVEDEADARRLLARALERAGYTCHAIATRAEAHEVAQRERLLDVIVTDVVLAGDAEGGLELLTELRARGAHVPVVVVTAFADVARVKRALNAGAAYLLEKPFRAQELVDVLARVAPEAADLWHHVERAFAHAGLTEKERVVALHVLKGLTSAEIAALENNSEKTIRQHLTRIYAKCGVSTRAELFHHLFPV